MKPTSAVATLLSATALFLTPPEALAGRRLAMTTLEASTVHGGVIGTNVCFSANMLGAGSYAGPSPVTTIYHSYKFSFRNLSNVDQTIHMRILPGTKIISKKSSLGGTNPVPDEWGPQRNLGSATTRTITLPPNGEGLHKVGFSASSEGASIDPIDSVQDCNNPAIQPQVCLAMESTLVVEFEVEPDRGAVLGAVVMDSHRCNGYVDTMRTTPLNKDLNGGRPF